MKLAFSEKDWQSFIDKCCFTDKELQIIPYLKRGWYEIDIAIELDISRRTVCRRKKQISKKILKQL